MTPSFVTNRKEVLEQFNKLDELGLKVIYSRKTNPLCWEILKETDCEVSCHSMNAFREVEEKDKIWFYPFANGKEEYKEVLESGVNNFVVEREEDLRELLDNTDDPVNVLLRTKMKEKTIHTNKYYVYGMEVSRVKKLVEELAGNEKVGKLGIHFHRKTQNVSEWRLKEELSGFLPGMMGDIDILNIGGGIPADYKNINAKAIDGIFRKIKELREWLPDDVELYAEPGRYIAASPTVLKTEIIAIEEGTIFVDFSIYQGAIDTLIADVKLKVEGENEPGNGEKYRIKGKTPDAMDIIRYEVWLDNPKVGDVLTFLNAGAYNFRAVFCSLEEPKKKIID